MKIERQRFADRERGDLGAKLVEEFITEIVKEIKKRVVRVEGMSNE